MFLFLFLFFYLDRKLDYFFCGRGWGLGGRLVSFEFIAAPPPTFHPRKGTLPDERYACVVLAA